MPWERYKSHKIIEAAKIVNVVPGTGTTRTMLTVELADGTREDFLPSQPGMEDRVTVGDYAMRYPDGFRSVSPRQVFEDGYERMTQ